MTLGNVQIWYEISIEKSYHYRDFQAIRYVQNVQTVFSNNILHIFLNSFIFTHKSQGLWHYVQWFNYEISSS